MASRGRDRSAAQREQRKRGATERQVAYVALSLKERIKRLDEMFGPGQGAKQERARIAMQLKRGS